MSADAPDRSCICNNLRLSRLHRCEGKGSRMATCAEPISSGVGALRFVGIQTVNGSINGLSIPIPTHFVVGGSIVGKS
jgi:hypothetical protein